MNNRGFIFTIFSLVFFGLLLTHSFSWLSINDSFLQSSQYAKNRSNIALILDDASFLIASVYPFTFFPENNSIRYTTHFSDYNQSFLTDANAVLINYFSTASGVSFSTDVRAVQEEPSVFLNGEKMILYHPSKNTDSFISYQTTQGVSLIQVDENVFVSNGDFNHATPWSWDPNGSVEVHVTYKDSQTTVPLSGKLNPTQNNVYVFELADGNQLTLQLFTQEGQTVWKTMVSPGLVVDVNAEVKTNSVTNNSNYTFPIPYVLSYRDVLLDGNLPAIPRR